MGGRWEGGEGGGGGGEGGGGGGAFFFFNDTATTEIYTLSLHDALPICCAAPRRCCAIAWAPTLLNMATTFLMEASPLGALSPAAWLAATHRAASLPHHKRSEEHTSELQSHSDLVCRLLLEKKKNKKK